MVFPDAGDFSRLARALGHSLRGIRAVYKSEAAFRLEVLVAVVLVPIGFWLGADGTERALLIGTVLLVMLVELINSGIEAVVDRIGGERHELSGRAKDAGSAAVLFALINAAVVWAVILLI